MLTKVVDTVTTAKKTSRKLQQEQRTIVHPAVLNPLAFFDQSLSLTFHLDIKEPCQEAEMSMIWDL